MKNLGGLNFDSLEILYNKYTICHSGYYSLKKISSTVSQILRIADIKVSVNSPWFESLRSLGPLAKESKDIICQKVYLKLNAELLKPWPFSSLVFGLVTQIQTLVQSFPSWSFIILLFIVCWKDCSLNRKKSPSLAINLWFT